MNKTLLQNYCPVCNSQVKCLIGRNDKYKYYHCKNCDLVLSNPIPSCQEIEDLYSQFLFRKPEDKKYFVKQVKEINADVKKIIKDIKLTNKKAEELLNNEKIRKKIPFSGSLKIPVLDDEGKVKEFAIIYEKEEYPKKYLLLKSLIKSEAIKKILVVGGASYLGSILCRKLLDKSYKVKVLDHLMYGDDGIKELYNNQNFEFIKGDIRNLQIVMKAAKGTDAVIHLAAIVGDPASVLNPEETIETNYLATKILAEVCKYSQINRFVFASTCSVYGANPIPEIKLSEDSLLTPISLYAEMKLKSEQAILELVDENFSPTILRIGTLYGLSPRMRFDLVINLLTAKAVVDKKINIFGGDQWRPFIHVKDIADAFIKCIEAPINKIKGEIFNVGANEQNYQLREIGEIIHNEVPDSKLIIEKKDIDSRSYNVSFNKIQNVLGFKPKCTIKGAITEIKDAIKKGGVSDYKDRKYSNYKFQ